MRENQGKKQFRDCNSADRKILFVEYYPLFTRHDIIKRLIFYKPLLRRINSIGVIYFENNRYILLLIRNNDELVIYGKIKDLLDYYLDGCKEPLIYLTENAEKTNSSLLDANCYISGLHNDIPLVLEKYIRENYRIKEFKLSNVNYLATQVLLILDGLLSIDNGMFYNLFI